MELHFNFQFLKGKKKEDKGIGEKGEPMLITILSILVVGLANATGTTTTIKEITDLKQQNLQLRTLNARLRRYINHHTNSFLQIDEEPDFAANKEASDQATNNFCLAPAECQEKLFACRRHAIEKCWQTDYAKGGAPPGSGDLDQDRLAEINHRVKQKLVEIGIDLDCDPSASGVPESTTMSSGGDVSAVSSGGSSGSGGSGGSNAGPQSEKSENGPRFKADTDIYEMGSSLREGIVKLDH